MLIVAGSRWASNLFCLPYLVCQNRSTSPRKPIRIHFHSANKNILKDGHCVGKCIKSQSLASLEGLTYRTMKRLKMESNSFSKLNSCYDVKRRAARHENLFGRTSSEIQCEPTVEPKKMTYLHKNTGIHLYRTDKVSVLVTCQINSCKRKIPYAIESPVFTWPSCGVCQKVKAAKKGTTARLCAQIARKAEVWLTAFTDVMKN